MYEINVFLSFNEIENLIYFNLSTLLKEVKHVLNIKNMYNNIVKLKFWIRGEYWAIKIWIKHATTVHKYELILNWINYKIDNLLTKNIWKYFHLSTDHFQRKMAEELGIPTLTGYRIYETVKRFESIRNLRIKNFLSFKWWKRWEACSLEPVLPHPTRSRAGSL